MGKSRRRVIGHILRIGDARKLAAWWNLHRGAYYHQYRVERCMSNQKYWDVICYR